MLWILWKEYKGRRACLLLAVGKKMPMKDKKKQPSKFQNRNETPDSAEDLTKLLEEYGISEEVIQSSYAFGALGPRTSISNSKRILRWLTILKARTKAELEREDRMLCLNTEVVHQRWRVLVKDFVKELNRRTESGDWITEDEEKKTARLEKEEDEKKREEERKEALRQREVAKRKRQEEEEEETATPLQKQVRVYLSSLPYLGNSAFSSKDRIKELCARSEDHFRDRVFRPNPPRADGKSGGGKWGTKSLLCLQKLCQSGLWVPSGFSFPEEQQSFMQEVELLLEDKFGMKEAQAPLASIVYKPLAVFSAVCPVCNQDVSPQFLECACGGGWVSCEECGAFRHKTQFSCSHVFLSETEREDARQEAAARARKAIQDSELIDWEDEEEQSFVQELVKEEDQHPVPDSGGESQTRPSPRTSMSLNLPKARASKVSNSKNQSRLSGFVLYSNKP